MHDKTLSELAAALTAGEFTSRELTEHQLARIARLDGELNSFITVTAEQALAAADAAETFAAILQEEPNNAPAYAGLVRSYLALDDVDQAEAVLNGAPAEISTDPLLEAVHAQITLAREAANAGPVAELQATVEADPDNHQARFDFATALHADGQAQEAVDQLLELFRRDREWNEAAAKTQLIKLFDSLGPKDPVAQKGRRRLSSLIFA